MSRVKKKILGIMGLLAVAAMTITATIIPVATYANSSRVNVTIQVDRDEFDATFATLTGGTVLVEATGTTRVDYVNATDLVVEMTDPLGVTSTIFNTFSGPADGNVYVNYDFSTGGYGDYTFSIYGEDLNNVSQVGQTVTVSYHSAYFDIEDDPNNDDPVVNVTFGPEVCGVSFQLYSTAPSADPNEGLLDPPYSLIGTPDFTSLPGFASGYVTITIPLSEYGIPTGNYRIVMTTYDCSPNNDVIEDDLESQNGGFTFVRKDGGGEELPPEVPDTGVIKIGGLTISHSDLMVSASIGFLTIIAIYFFLRSRRKIKM